MNARALLVVLGMSWFTGVGVAVAQAPSPDAGVAREEPPEPSAPAPKEAPPSPTPPAQTDTPAAAPATDAESSPPAGEESELSGSGDGADQAPDAPVDANDQGEDESSTARDSAGDVYAGLDATGTPPLPPRESSAPSRPWTENYDGRPSSGARAEDVLIWIPRLPLLPVHLALEYLLRRPLTAVVATAEENFVFERIVSLFTFADGRGLLYPAFFYDFGRGLAASANFSLSDAGVEGHTIRASAGYQTAGGYDLTVTDEWQVFDNDAGLLTFQGTFREDPTFSFTGVGPDTSIDDEVFFGERRAEAFANLRVALAGLNRFNARLAYRNVKLVDGQDPSIDADDSPFDPANITGFRDPYNLFSAGLGLELDTRSPDREFTPGSGLRLEGWGSFNASVGDPELRFLRYRMQPTAFWDISGVNHVLAFSIYMEAISRVGGEDVPTINELVTLGGDHMKGFLIGRFRGESAMVYSLTYSWPVFFFADGVLFAELGNAFEGFFERLHLKRMAADWGVGFRTSFSREFAVNVLIAFGTNQIEQWDESFDVDRIRFVFGASQVF